MLPKSKERLKNTNYSGLTLTAIVIVYLVCNLPRLIINLVEYTLRPEIYQLGECGCFLTHWWVSSMIRISHLLLTINSSVNFIIYFSSSKQFKKILQVKCKKLLTEVAVNLRQCDREET